MTFTVLWVFYSYVCGRFIFLSVHLEAFYIGRPLFLTHSIRVESWFFFFRAGNGTHGLIHAKFYHRFIHAMLDLAFSKVSLINYAWGLLILNIIIGMVGFGLLLCCVFSVFTCYVVHCSCAPVFFRLNKYFFEFHLNCTSGF